MPVMGIAMINNSQFNRKRGPNSTETMRQNVQFLLKHLVPAIPLIYWVLGLWVGFPVLVMVVFFQLSPFKFYLGARGLARPSHTWLLYAHRNDSQMNPAEH